ncbi:MAG: MATE family efflux transporter, partial [Candidatus Binataceae bacterium]
MTGVVESVPRFDRRVGTALSLPAVERMRWAVWALAWPVILAFMLDSVVGLTSMLMVGRLGAEAVGAVGLATQIMFAVGAGISAVGTGTVALVARYIGATDRDSAEDVLWQSILLGVVVSLVIALPVIVFADQLMSVFQVKGETAAMGVRYLRIVMLAEPFQAVWM